MRVSVKKRPAKLNCTISHDVYWRIYFDEPNNHKHHTSPLLFNEHCFKCFVYANH